MSVGHHNPPPRPRDGISSALVLWTLTFCFHSIKWLTYLLQFAIYITDIHVNGGRKSTIIEFDQGDIFEDISLPETTHFVS